MMKASMVRFLRGVLAWAARRYLRRGSAYVIGVTGSVGKTSCRQAIVAVLRTMLPHRRVSTPYGNLNGEIGLPMGILEIQSYEPTPRYLLRTLWIALRKGISGKPAYDIVVLEYGIDRPGEMAHMLGICTPQIGVLTPIDGVHAANFESFEQLQQNKQHLVTASTDCVFVPSALMTNTLRQEIRADWFSYGSDDAIVRISDIADTADGVVDDDVDDTDKSETSASDVPDVQRERGSPHVSFGLIVHDVPLVRLRTDALHDVVYDYIAIGAVIADVIAMRYDGCSLFPCLEMPFVSLPPTSGRGQILDGIAGSVLIDQTYNAAPASMRAAIEGAVAYRDRCAAGAAMLCILGDMRELGDMSTAEHIELAGIIEPYIDAGMTVVFVGKETTTTADALGMRWETWGDDTVLPGERVGEQETGRVYHVTSSTAAGVLARSIVAQHTDQQYVVMAKGSQNTIYTEEALAYLMASPDDISTLPRQSRTRRRKKEQRFAQAGAPMMASMIDFSSIGAGHDDRDDTPVSPVFADEAGASLSDDVSSSGEKHAKKSGKKSSDRSTSVTGVILHPVDSQHGAGVDAGGDELERDEREDGDTGQTGNDRDDEDEGHVGEAGSVRRDSDTDSVARDTAVQQKSASPTRQLYRPAEWQIDSDDPMIV